MELEVEVKRLKTMATKVSPEKKAADAKAAEDKAKAQAAKAKLHVPATPNNSNKKGTNKANSPQAGGTNNQGAAVTFTTPATLPPAPG